MKTFMHIGRGSGSGYVEALKQGMRNSGMVEIGRSRAYADVLIGNGKDPKYTEWREDAQSKGVSLLFVDLGYLRRGVSQSDPEGYFQVGWGDLNSIYTGRAKADRFDALGLTVEDDVDREDGYHMILGQVAEDTQHGMNREELGELYLRYYQEILESGVPHEKIVLRKHPRDPILPEDVRQTFNLIQDGTESTLEESLDECRCVVTYNSTGGLQAILRGTPVIATGKPSYAGLCGSEIGDETHLREVKEKLSFFRQVAYSQWRISELESGEAWKFIKSQKRAKRSK